MVAWSSTIIPWELENSGCNTKLVFCLDHHPGLDKIQIEVNLLEFWEID